MRLNMRRLLKPLALASLMLVGTGLLASPAQMIAQMMTGATPNMGLSLPVPSVTIGPTWASMLVTALTSIDAHDHTSGKGVQVPTAGLNINADLPMNGQFVADAGGISLFNQPSLLSATTKRQTVYAEDANGDLWWNDGAGHQIQLTALGAANSGGTCGVPGGCTLRAPLTVQNGALSTVGTMDTSGNLAVTGYVSAGSGAYLYGDNINAATAGSNIAINSRLAAGSGSTDWTFTPGAVRSAGLLMSVNNNAVGQFQLDPNGNGVFNGKVTGLQLISGSSGINAGGRIQHATANTTLLINGNVTDDTSTAVKINNANHSMVGGLLEDLQNFSVSEWSVDYAGNTVQAGTVAPATAVCAGETLVNCAPGTGGIYAGASIGALTSIGSTQVYAHTLTNGIGIAHDGSSAPPPNSAMTILGTRASGADDIVINSTNTFNAGNLIDVQNNTTSKWAIDFNGKEVVPVGGGADTAGVSASMSAGSATISTTAVTANSVIELTHAGTATGNLGILYISAITGGTSFVAHSSNGADTDKVYWHIIN